MKRLSFDVVVMVLMIVFTTSFCSSQDLLSSITRQLSRVKRDALDESAFWSISCVTSMVRRVNNTDFNRTALNHFQHSPTTVCLEYSPEIFDHICRSYYITRRCLEYSPEGKMKIVLNDSLEILHFMCLERYKDVRHHLPCSMSSCKMVRNTCDRQCMINRRSVEKLLDALFLPSSPHYTRSALMKLMSNSCKYLTCHMDCRQPMITETCSENATVLENAMVKRLLVSIKEVMKLFLPRYALPDECQELSKNVAVGIHVSFLMLVLPLILRCIFLSGAYTHA